MVKSTHGYSYSIARCLMKKSLIPVMLFISIVLLLPLPWYNDMYGNPFTYKIEDMSGFQVFSIKYPIIYSYFASLVSLLYSSLKSKMTNLTLTLISIFCLLLVIFPVFLGAEMFSENHLSRLSLMLLIVISLSALSGFLIQHKNRRCLY